MGYLQALLLSYRHLRRGAAALTSTSAVAYPSRIPRPALSAAATGFPSSFPQIVCALINAVTVQTKPPGFVQLAVDRRWKRKRRRPTTEERVVAAHGMMINSGKGEETGSRRNVCLYGCLSLHIERLKHQSVQSSAVQARRADTATSSLLPMKTQCHRSGSVRRLQCEAVVFGESATRQSSKRRCHTNSTARLPTAKLPNSSSVIRRTGATLSLLDDILCHLENTSAAALQNALEEDKSSSESSSLSKPPSNAAATNAVEGAENLKKKPAYVPLLFRPGFIQSTARRRQQALLPQPPTILVTSQQRAETNPEPLPKPKASAMTAAMAATAATVSKAKLPCLSIALPHEQLVSTTGSAAPPKRSEDVKKKAGAPIVGEAIEVKFTAETTEKDQSTKIKGVSPSLNLAEEVVVEPSRGNAQSFNKNEDLGKANASDAATPTEPNHSTEKDKLETLDDLHDNEDGVSVEYDEAEEGDTCSVRASITSASTALRPRRSRQLILDPVEWLAMAADAPLMNTEVLHSNTLVKDQLEAAMEAGENAWATSSAATEAEDSLHDIAPTAESAPALFDAHSGVSMQQTRDSEKREAELLEDLMRDIPQQRRSKKEKPQRQLCQSLGENPFELQVPTNAAQTCGVCSSDAVDDNSNATATDDTAVVASARVEPGALVYNVFTRRVVKASSSSIRLLALLGIAVHPDTHELTLCDPDALRSLARELRAKRVSWPKLWSRGLLYRQLERLLSDEVVADPADRVADLLRTQYNKTHRLRQRPGLVVGDGSPTSDATTPLDSAAAAMAGLSSSFAPSAPSTMAESLDDKLLTLQDLNEEQQAVVELVMRGHHTYIGGGAGTGKSVLLRVIKQQLVREGLAVAMTGTTGIAGSQIGGCTLHHCLGINLGGEFTRRKELSSYDVIIIDEISMLSRELFESLEVHLRRANNIHLPFGGVQMILCGDFLQLGAIDARPLITSPLFRRNFVQLKLHTVVRHNANTRFAGQLQQLRRGQVPADLVETVHFVTPQQIVAEQAAEEELKRRQQAQLVALSEKTKSVVDYGITNKTSGTTEGTAKAMDNGKGGNDSANKVHTEDQTDKTPNGGSMSDSVATPTALFVHGAVNLLPTNHEVNQVNAQQLQQLPGELVRYVPQFLPPCTIGSWSPTFIIRIYEPGKLRVNELRKEILRYLCDFYKSGSFAPSPQQSAQPTVNFSDGEWLLNPHHGDHNIVLYPLFVDALVFRVRLPMTMDHEEAQQFLLHVAGLDRHLATLDLGVRTRDILPHGDGMHTEQDEYILSQYAARAPLAHPLDLKIGARVMLRTNFAPGLVNGSLGTVVGFRKLALEELPRYLVGNAQREEAIVQYSDFLQYEQGFQVPIVPVVDFNGRQVPIPPTTQYVGGMPNTHFYSMGVVALPLSLAYAFTVHKVQGLTLVGRVHLELSRMWPCEHLLYVAMSRVRNPDQLSVSSFHPRLVRAAADCLLFDDSLPTVWAATVAPYMLAATWRRSPSRRKKVLLKKKLEVDAKQRRSKLIKEARKGDLQAEIRLLEEKMLKQRAKAAARARNT